MKKFTKALALALTLALCVSVMGGCKKKADESSATATTEATESETESATESATESESETESATESETEATSSQKDDGAYPFELTDIYGQKAVIKAEPQKVVSCSPACTEIIFSLGQESKLVGRTNYCNYPEAASSIESIGDINAPDVEKIVSLNPDVVVADSIFPKEAYDKLTGLGVTVVILNEEKAVDGVYTKISNMGKILGATEEADKVIADMQAKINGVKEALKDVQNHPTVYYVVGFGEGGDWTATGETFINNIIELAGAENAAKSATGWAYNAEDLVKQDPNIIIIPAWADGTFQTTAPYKNLTAVKEGHVIVLESTDLVGKTLEVLRSLRERFFINDHRLVKAQYRSKIRTVHSLISVRKSAARKITATVLDVC